MKSFIIAALLFSVSASAQDRFYYSQTEYNWFEEIKEKYHPRSIDGMLYTRCISEDGHDEKYKEWIEKYPDGYEVYCGPCAVKINDYEAVEQTVYTERAGLIAAYGSMVHSQPWLFDTIVTKTDTIKCVMLVSELGGPAKHQNGYWVTGTRLKYLDANKVEVKGFVWLLQEFDWQNPDK